MMLTRSQHCKPLPSFDFDDIFLIPPDMVVSDEEFNNFTEFNGDDNEMILSELDLSPKNDQTQTLTTETLLCDPICRVCGAPATGYNFDQITCESCKAFFRRNALRHMPDLKCRYSGSCVINIHTRRQCTYCRLKKCFDVKMRKDWIRTEEETKLRQLQKLMKQERKLHKAETNIAPVISLPIVVRKKKRLLGKPFSVVQPILSGKYFGFHRNLDDIDNTWLNNITNAYQIGTDKVDCTFITKYDENTTLVQFMKDECSVQTSLIYFYKYIPEFKQLDIDDQVQLIKLNLRHVIHLHRIIIENFEDSPHIAKFMSKWINPEFHEQMSRTRRYFYRFTKYPLLLKLTLVVFMFSINLSTTHDLNQSENYKNTKQLIEHHDSYTALLWRYLNYLFDEKEAIASMEIMVTQILRYQILMNTMESYIRQMSKKEKIHELTETIFDMNEQTNSL